jgi:dihydrolipoamide dehydrogenase
MNLSYKGIQSVKEYEGKLEIVSGDKKILVNKILVTTGRSHQLDKLGIENTSVEINQRGIPIFDEETFQVKGPNHIFLAGDITGTKQILHEASDEGRIAGFNCVHDPVAFQTRTPLGITFSDPNIAFTGLTFNQIEQQKISIEIGEVLFEGQGRSIVKLKEIGMLRVYGSKSDNRLIGAELFAPGGEHLAHLLSWVISQKLTVQEVLALPFYHPVVEEGLRTALRNLRDKLDPNNDVSGHLEIMKRE